MGNGLIVKLQFNMSNVKMLVFYLFSEIGLNQLILKIYTFESHTIFQVRNTKIVFLKK